MAITFPLTLPTTGDIVAATVRACSTVGQSESIFTKSRQTYVHQAEWWELDVEVSPMFRADAAEWMAFLASLNGLEGTFLAGDSAGATPRGVATGTPVVNGASQSGKTLSTRGWTAGVTGILLPQDWIQIGTGASTHLHMVVQSADSASGSPGAGVASLEIWPRLRSSPADGAAIVVSSAKGLWRLADNRREWSVVGGGIYGIRFSCVEAL